jgi:uncharacterized membrane protein
MSNKTAVLSALAGVLALGLCAPSALAAEGDGMEKCAGVIKAGKNDCATSKNACHSHVTTDNDPEAWIFVPKGTCEKIAGARVTVAANTNVPPRK